jgi:hypothetical protein
MKFYAVEILDGGKPCKPREFLVHDDDDDSPRVWRTKAAARAEMSYACYETRIIPLQEVDE